MTFLCSIVLLGLAAIYAPLRAQTRIGGVINTYAAVRAITLDCRQVVELQQPINPLPSGSRILIIQMQGASADVATGTLADRGGAGTFEYATVAQATATTLVLASPLRNTYNVNAAVQVVVVPRYTNATVTSTLRPAPWNGTVGGVLALDVQGTLRLEANIDASGCGFRGGRKSLSFSARCGNASLFLDYDLGTSGEKGEGLCRTPPSFLAGRAPWANGGGGGADVNGGGGGGGGAGAGGQGGYQVDTCPLPRTSYGLGGDAVDNPRNTIALIAGGGGGGGHQNNGSGSDGAAGGGIVIIRAGTLQAGDYAVLACGNDAADAHADGGGGGGGGGSIVLEVGSLQGNPTINVSGGKGGTVDRATSLHGPGGGGGGGRIIYANQRAPVGVTNVLRGGFRGGNRSRPTTSGDHGSQDGAAGSLVLLAIIPLEPPTATTLTAQLPADTMVCRGTVIDIPLRSTGGYAPVQRLLTDRRGTPLAADVPTMRLTAVADTMLILTVRDSVGCIATDTMHVRVENRAALLTASVDAGVYVCERFVDTAVVFTNPSIDDVVVRSIDVITESSVVSIPALPLTLAPGQSLRIPVRLLLPVNDGQAVATIRLTSTACVPVMDVTVSARALRPRWQHPPSVAIAHHVRCAGPPGDVRVEVLSQSSGAATVTADTAWIDAPFMMTKVGPAAWRITWVPGSEGVVTGTLTAVLMPCGDTVRIPVSAASTNRNLVVRGGGRVHVVTETVDVEVENTGTAPATITHIDVSDPAYTITVAGGGLPRVLAPGERLRCTIAVENSGAPATATVSVRSAIPCDTTMTVGISRQRGVMARITVGSATAAPNDRVEIDVSISDVQTNVASLLTRWRATVAFDGASVMPIEVTPPSVTARWRRDAGQLVVDMEGPWNGEGVVATLALHAMLANPPVTPITVDTAVPLWDGLPSDVFSDVTVDPGVLDLTGTICERSLRAIAVRGFNGTLTMYDLLGRAEREVSFDASTDLHTVIHSNAGVRFGVLRSANGSVVWRGVVMP